ncbi:GPO family capsid scaffolding protein [Vibrio sp. 10N.261.55.A7]|uniref:GPO family capsid scaffolding protein n=1 Tax=Vibrio sp. 10N.261.55.A7 TaxID=1880851 RepID=UPI000C8451BF|nr:GPO family capsid scaffolding protein [Vibrio sp. 10N.261.55.A7]PMJ92850.1 phage capsid protein [Vibrio sp. 10N.261.55.A7]
MPKISDWKIIATEGPTVDGRKIQRDWITQMAESYSLDHSPAMIWPEHRRFSGFGANWGRVVEVKAEEQGGKLRLFAKLLPNQYLLEANKLGQKLFTSIEPEPDFQGEGRCYLMGLAVTDSPASTGTSLLQFNRQQGETTQLECSHLEEIDLDECFTRTEKFMSVCKEFFSSGDDEPETPSIAEDTDVTEEQLKAALRAQFSVFKGELKQELTDELKQEFAQQEGGELETPDVKPEGATVEQFSAALTEQLKPLTEQVKELETKFNSLVNDEAPEQRPDASGGSGNTMEVA